MGTTALNLTEELGDDLFKKRFVVIREFVYTVRRDRNCQSMNMRKLRDKVSLPLEAPLAL